MSLMARLEERRQAEHRAGERPDCRPDATGKCTGHRWAAAVVDDRPAWLRRANPKVLA
jgi:hypothetical protein